MFALLIYNLSHAQDSGLYIALYRVRGLEPWVQQAAEAAAKANMIKDMPTPGQRKRRGTG